MRAWIDCEFTDLDEPDLLSVGIVSEAGQEFYLELLDDVLERRSSAFVHDTVLPMFGVIAGARAASYLEFTTRACDFLLSLEEPIRVVFDYAMDRELLEHALQQAPRWAELKILLSWEFAPAAAYESDIGAAAMEEVWRDEPVTGLGRHHALADARALRAACLALEAGA
jgi:3' exoribonuclease, RNase T-like